VSPDDLQREADVVSEAVDALQALDLNAPELGAVDAKLAEAQQRMESIHAANAEAVAKMEELLEPFAGYVEEAYELTAAAC
jgi:hypothetical protein